METQKAKVPHKMVTAKKLQRRSGVRWMMPILLGVGMVIAYIDRANMSVAIGDIKDEFGFGAAMQGIILGAWVWTYAVFQLPAGWFVDKFGARFTYAAAIVWWSLATAAISLVRGVGGLIGLRLLLGIGEAPIAPATAKVTGEWFPKRERGLASGLHGWGSEAGAAVAVPLVAALMLAVGWRGTFAVCGAMGIAMALLWLWLYRRPAEHKWANTAEVEYIRSDSRQEDSVKEQADTVKWRQLFRFRTVWGMFFGYICRNFLNYFFITWYPTYLISAEGFTTLDLAKYGAIPGFIAIFANILGGAFTDWLVRRGLSLGTARKLPIALGTLAAGSIGLTALTDGPVMAIVFLSIGFAGSSFASAAIQSLPIDVAPGAGNVGSIHAIQNTGSQIGGLVSPIVIGFLVAATGSFVLPLTLMAALCILAVCIYVFMVDVRPLTLQEAQSVAR